MLHPHFCRLMKDHKRLVATESIPILSTTSSKTQNSVVPLLLSMNYYFVWLDGVNKGYHTGTIRPLTHKYSSAKLLAFKICDFFAYDYCINLCISQFHAILIFFSSFFLNNSIISSSICKLPIRSKIYNCTFKNTNKVSIIVISAIEK